MEETIFLTAEQVAAIREAHGTPVFVYDEQTLERQAQTVLAFPNAYGLTARYAMKALPTAAILRVFDRCGLHLDASSGYEAERAMHAGIAPGNIQITAQELPGNLKELVQRGCLFNACSLRQLDIYGQLFPGSEVSIRVNPGLGSGHSNRTNVGGPSSSFGIWHAYIEDAQEIASRRGLCITGMHTHIGSGTDPHVWVHCATLSLKVAARLPEVRRLSLGGGFKPARMACETGADLQAIGNRLLHAFERFAHKYSRELHLEIEPGTFLTANAGALVSTVTDIVDTGPEGCRFLKIDSGMNDILRPSLYGAQHPIILFPATPRPEQRFEYLVVGHCCESGDLMTPKPNNPERLSARMLPEAAVGDALVVGGAGAYCSSMAAKNYNSFPESAEILFRQDGELTLIRERQTLAQMVQNECLE